MKLLPQFTHQAETWPSGTTKPKFRWSNHLVTKPAVWTVDQGIDQLLLLVVPAHFVGSFFGDAAWRNLSQSATHDIRATGHRHAMNPVEVEKAKRRKIRLFCWSYWIILHGNKKHELFFVALGGFVATWCLFRLILNRGHIIAMKYVVKYTHSQYWEYPCCASVPLGRILQDFCFKHQLPGWRAQDRIMLKQLKHVEAKLLFRSGPDQAC